MIRRKGALGNVHSAEASPAARSHRGALRCRLHVVVMDPVKAVNGSQKTAELLYRDRLLDFSKVGGKAAELAFHVLVRENLRLLSATDRSSNPIIINWRVLKKLKVSLGPKDLI